MLPGCLYIIDIQVQCKDGHICILVVQAGALDPFKVLFARNNHEMKCNGGNVRQLIKFFSEQEPLSDFGRKVVRDAIAIVDAVEQETNAVLDYKNKEGFQMFRERIGVLSMCLMSCGSNSTVTCDAVIRMIAYITQHAV